MVNCHKIMLLQVFPLLQSLLCKYCTEGHEDIVIIFPGVGEAQIKQARDDLYIFGDNSAMQKLFENVLDDKDLDDNVQHFIMEEDCEGEQVYICDIDVASTETRDILMRDMHNSYVNCVTTTLKQKENLTFIIM